MGCGSSTPQQPTTTTTSPASVTATSAATVTVDHHKASSVKTTASNNKTAYLESRQIDSELEKARNEDIHKIKMLLLGAGESGKSTIFKQMRLLYGNAQRSDDDLRMYGVVVRSNIVVAIRKLVSHLHDLGLEEELDREAKYTTTNSATGSSDDAVGVSVTSCREAYDELMTYLVENSGAASSSSTTVAQDPTSSASTAAANGHVVGAGGTTTTDWVGTSPRAGLAANNDAKLFLTHYKAMEILWKSQTIKQVWAKRSAVNIIDSHKDYLNDILRIASPTYQPTTHDILISRVRTTQVVMEKYRIDGIDFEVYDVGGQRSERRKWIDCFDSVTAVIFVAALSEYDQNLAEAKRTNRMVEALELFRSVCNNRAFANTSIMLFLNKKDVFMEKIQYSDIAAQRPFCDYAGPTKDSDHGVLYFIQKFKDCLIDDEFNDSFIHVTCATDTNNMEFVLESTRTIIMTDNLKRSGFLGAD